MKGISRSERQSGWKVALKPLKLNCYLALCKARYLKIQRISSPDPEDMTYAPDPFKSIQVHSCSLHLHVLHHANANAKGRSLSFYNIISLLPSQTPLLNDYYAGDHCNFIVLQAPSLPNSFVHSAFLARSLPLTVGLAVLMALTKSFTFRGGSSSFSESTSTQVISTAPLSPGEQGVNFSSPSTVTCKICQCMPC